MKMANIGQTWIVGGGCLGENGCHFVAFDRSEKEFYYCKNDNSSSEIFQYDFEILTHDRGIDIVRNKKNNCLIAITNAQNDEKPFVVELEKTATIPAIVVIAMMSMIKELTDPVSVLSKHLVAKVSYGIRQVEAREKQLLADKAEFEIRRHTCCTMTCCLIAAEKIDYPILTITGCEELCLHTIERGEICIDDEKLLHYNIVKICDDIYNRYRSSAYEVVFRDMIRANVIIVNYKHLWHEMFDGDKRDKLKLIGKKSEYMKFTDQKGLITYHDIHEYSCERITCHSSFVCEGSLYIIIVVDGPFNEISLTGVNDDTYTISCDDIMPNMWAKTWVSVRDHTIGYASGRRAFIVGNCQPRTRIEDSAYYLDISINRAGSRYYNEWYALHPTTAIEDGYLISTKVTPEDVDRDPNGSFIRLLDEFGIARPNN